MGVTENKLLKERRIMSTRSKKEYIEAIYLRYKNASRKQKTPILNECCATLKIHRKHAIRLLKKIKRFRKTKTNKAGRAPFHSQPCILNPSKKSRRLLPFLAPPAQLTGF
jgi:hypothetical protein